VEVEEILGPGTGEEGKRSLDEKTSFDPEKSARGKVSSGDEPQFVEGDVTDWGEIVEICILTA
jgi:hypothetical protein